MSVTDRIREDVERSRERARQFVNGRPAFAINANTAEALCDLADAERDRLDWERRHDPHHQGFCLRCERAWPCPTQRARDALARLDGEDGP